MDMLTIIMVVFIFVVLVDIILRLHIMIKQRILETELNKQLVGFEKITEDINKSLEGVECGER